MHQVCETFDEAAIVSYQSTECSYLGVGLWHRKLFNGMHILFTWVNSFTGDMMHKVHYSDLEGALGWLQLQIKFSEALKDYT